MALSGVDVAKMQWVGDNLREDWRRFKQHAELMFSGPLKSRSKHKRKKPPYFDLHSKGDRTRSCETKRISTREALSCEADRGVQRTKNTR